MPHKEEMKKITLEVPVALLTRLKTYTGAGTTYSIRTAMEHYAQMEAQKALLELRGAFKPSITVEEMRGWEDDDRN